MRWGVLQDFVFVPKGASQEEENLLLYDCLTHMDGRAAAENWLVTIPQVTEELSHTGRKVLWVRARWTPKPDSWDKEEEED